MFYAGHRGNGLKDKNFINGKRKPEVYSGSFALHIASAVPSIIVSFLSPNVLRIESICHRKVVFSVLLSENMY